MARVKFLGPSAERRMEFPDGTVLNVRRGEIYEMPDWFAASIREAGSPRSFEVVDGGHTAAPRSVGPSVLSEQPKKSRMGKEER